MVSPPAYLSLIVLLTVCALAISVTRRRRTERAIRAVCASHGMNYAADDRFRLAMRIAPHLPCPGAATVVVRDLAYGTRQRDRRYVFTVEYTVGAVRMKKRYVAVASLLERSSGERDVVQVARQGQPLVEQYRQLISEDTAPLPPAPSTADGSNPALL